METILQFGSGRFLRGFVDLFIHQANEQGQALGSVVIVQSTGRERARLLNQQHGRYHVAIRGLAHGSVVDQIEECRCVSRALHAPTQWAEVLTLAESPVLQIVISNTTEAGYTVADDEQPGEAVPRSYPAQLLAVLHARWRAGLPGLTIIPCELIDHNAATLRSQLVRLAARWNLSNDFADYITRNSVFQHTLVDRIVVGPPPNHPLRAIDPLLITAEPFAFFALEEHPASAFRLVHPAVHRTPNVAPYFLRKVRILNAAHTALAPLALTRGFTQVRNAVNDPDLGRWLRRLLLEEIVPLLHGRVDEPEWFVERVFERFRNPLIDHHLSDIVLHHEAKMAVRLEPSLREFEAHFGRTPPLLCEALAAGRALLKAT